jgi:long-chain acyl-CoA synthetase
MPHTLQPYPESTLLDTVGDTVQQRPEHPALIFKGRQMSYAELEQLSNAFATALVNLGVQKGDRVALLIPNSPQAIIAQLGAWKAGAIVCPINSCTPRRAGVRSLRRWGRDGRGADAFLPESQGPVGSIGSSASSPQISKII